MAEISITFKGMADKPWITVRAESVKEAQELMDHVDQNFLDHVAGTATSYTQFVPSSAEQLVENVLGGTPVAPQEAPTGVAALSWPVPTQVAPQAVSVAQGASNARTCVHGTMTLKEGRSGKGPWAAWFCGWGDKATQCQPVDAVSGVEWPKKK